MKITQWNKGQCYQGGSFNTALGILSPISRSNVASCGLPLRYRYAFEELFFIIGRRCLKFELSLNCLTKKKRLLQLPYSSHRK